jgi:hypothetical protein
MLGDVKEMLMKPYWILGLLILGLTSCGGQASQGAPPEIETPSPRPPAASLPVLGPAPELTNEVWLNVDAPLRLAGLRGKVVAIDMWTFG